MISNRQKYFQLTKLNSKYLPKNVIYDLLCLVNNFRDFNELLFHFDDEIHNENQLDEYIKNILLGKPYQYVINKCVFNELELYVDESVLIPRQETAELFLRSIEEIKTLSNRQNLTILDVCCGSGCLGLSYKNTFKNADVYLSDISSKALNVAKKNADKLSLDIHFFEGDLLKPFIENNIKADVIVSNPPYIRNESTVDEQTLKYEPHLALFMNPPTKCYEEIFIQSKEVLKDDGMLFFEIGEDLEEELTPLVLKYFSNKIGKFLKDIYGKTRFLFIK
jgi:release factor glutamine methyltransferase